MTDWFCLSSQKKETELKDPELKETENVTLFYC